MKATRAESTERAVRTTLVTLLAATVLLAGCTGPAQPVPGPTRSGPVKIQFWHAMGGVSGTVLNGVVERFNASQKDVLVEAIFQGDDDQTLSQLTSRLHGGASANLPALVQVPDVGTRFMIDSKQTRAVQEFIDRDGVSTSDYEPNILAYYQVNNRLYGMPFNISTPLLYYNKTAFKEAGLNPEQPPGTFDEVAAAAKKLTRKDGSGRVTQYGMAIAVYGGFMEQFIAAQNAQYANNGNGRDKLASAVTFDNEAGVNALTWWRAMVQDGICANFGRATTDTQKAFDAGRTAMFIDSAAVLAGRITGVGGRFEIGTGFLPRPADARGGGVIPGGAAVWIMKGRPDAEQQGAWKFIKFLTSPSEQAAWHIGTGYFPIRRAAYDDPTEKEWRSKYPQFDTAIDQLRKSPVNTATRGALLGIFAQSRRSVEGAVEKALLNQAPPRQALREAAEALKPDLEAYNRSVR